MGHHLIELKEDQSNMAEGGSVAFYLAREVVGGVDYLQTHPTKRYKKQTPSPSVRLVYFF